MTDKEVMEVFSYIIVIVAFLVGIAVGRKVG
jgi:hypothetical protein